MGRPGVVGGEYDWMVGNFPIFAWQRRQTLRLINVLLGGG
jgi:hypothetical protein